VKICVIGNSHIACLKHAVQNGALDGTGADIVFFGAPGKNFKKIQFRDGVIRGPEELRDKLLLVSEGRYTQIDPAEFDVVVIYGGAFCLHILVGGIHRALKNKVHISEKCLETGIERWTISKHTFRLAREIGKTSSTTRAILVPRPIPANGAAVESGNVNRHIESDWLWDTLELAFRRKIWDICRQAAERRGVEIFLQPETTIDANQFTKSEFTANSLRLLNPKAAHEQADVSHMNAKFGENVLLSLLDHLAQTAEHPR